MELFKSPGGRPSKTQDVDDQSLEEPTSMTEAADKISCNRLSDSLTRVLPFLVSLTEQVVSGAGGLVWVSCNCRFPIRGAPVQSVLGVAGTTTSLTRLSAFLELT